MSKLLNLLFAASFSVDPFGGLTLLRTVLLEGDTHHVQGVAIAGGSVFVTAVDRPTAKGFLFEYDLETGRRLRSVEIQEGAKYHPGGFDIDDESLWIPVAEYKRDGTTVIQRRSLRTLELLSRFEVNDHIGCLTRAGSSLIGGNWDARKLYEWTLDGAQLSVRTNPRPTRYQELKYRYGSLIGSGPGAIEWLDPETLRPLQSISTGKTDRGVPFGQEGFDLRDGLIYLLPEDAPSRLFVLRD